MSSELLGRVERKAGSASAARDVGDRNRGMRRAISLGAEIIQVSNAFAKALDFDGDHSGEIVTHVVLRGGPPESCEEFFRSSASKRKRAAEFTKKG